MSNADDNTARKVSLIEERLDPERLHTLAIGGQTPGEIMGVRIASMLELMDFAKLMAVAGIGIREHLRGNAGACLAVAMQAIEWKMSPFQVANKSYKVKDQIAYESQLVMAVIISRAPIKGRPKSEYIGEGADRVCRIWAELRYPTGEIVEYRSPPFGKISPKNSPLWTTDPDQQQYYFSARAWCRRHFPDVLLGVYAEDELVDLNPGEVRDVTPSLADRLAPRSTGEGFSHKAEEIEAALAGAKAGSPSNETEKINTAPGPRQEAAGEPTPEPAATAPPAQQDAPPATRRKRQAKPEAVPNDPDAITFNDPIRYGGPEYLPYLGLWTSQAPTAEYVDKRFKAETGLRNSLGTPLTAEEREQAAAMRNAAMERLKGAGS